MTAARWAAVFLLALTVAGCARGGGPKVRPYSGAAPEPAASSLKQNTVAAIAVQSGGVHVVRRGETLFAIARAYGAPLRALILQNGLTPPYALEIGQKLAIPQATVHVVRSGDTVYGISRQYGVAMNDLVRENGIEPPFTIKVDQRLVIPARLVEARASIAVETLPDASVKVAVEQLDAPEPKAAIAAPEPVPVAAGVAPGGEPPPDPQTVQRIEPAAPTSKPFRVTEAGYPRPPVRPTSEPARPLLAGAGPIPKPAPRQRAKFLWPVQGRLIAGFGPAGAGLHNDGINVAAPRGSPVRAAENGVVVYSGSELKGFGNLVLLKHADGYMTAYAHNADLLVTRGQTVRRGQTIARVGSSGDVDRPQLHFELRKGRKAINPISLLEG